MRSIVSILSLLLILGCASAQQPAASGEASLPAQKFLNQEEAVEKEQERRLRNIEEDKLKEYEVESGVIIAKTDFQGVLEKTYVKLLFEDIHNVDNKFYLYIGDKAGAQSFPWDVKPVKPGYFFVELPAGTYRISSISIPVGSTLATEDINITVEVLPEKVSYVGTLQVIGTKERIKLGGVPVFKPGFEYEAQILNEKEEAMQTFRQQYPNFSREIVVQLMELNQPPVIPES